MVGIVKPVGLSYVDRVNGDKGLEILSFDADQCDGIRASEPVMSAPAIGAIFGVVGIAALYTMIIGGGRRR